MGYRPPNHISNTVLSTVHLGPLRETRTRGSQLINSLSRGLRILSVAVACVVQVDSP